MTPIGSRPIWFETFPQLVARWYDRQSEDLRHEVGPGPANAVVRAETRAAKVLAYSGVNPLREKKTPRHWETRWNAEETWDLLEKALDRLGWDAVRESGTPVTAQVHRTALFESDRETVVIADEALGRQLKAVLDGGLLLPLTEDDMAAIALAREVYNVAGEKMGSPPPDWVEDLARHEFVRTALGLPFSPLALQFV